MTRLVVGALSMMVLVACGPSPSGPDGGGCGPSTLTPANTLANGGFECGDATTATAWTAVAGTMTVETTGARSGKRALKVVADPSGNGSVGTPDPVVTSTSGKTYCLTAYVRGTTPDVRLEALSSGGQGMSFGSPVATDNWLRVPPSTNLEVRVAAGQQLFVRVRTHNGRAGDTLFVDDVDLWESADGFCRER